MTDPVLCPTCGQPASSSLSGDGTIECRNEACPEYGQILGADEQAPDAAPSPTPMRDEP